MRRGREGGRHWEENLRKPLSMWHIISCAVLTVQWRDRLRQMLLLSRSVSFFLGGFHKPVSEMNALLEALQSYVSVQLHLQSSSLSRRLTSTSKTMDPSFITDTLAENKRARVFRAKEEWITTSSSQCQNILRLGSFWGKPNPRREGVSAGGLLLCYLFISLLFIS